MAQKNITLGLVAHVDSGKTTLTEAMLVGAGALRQAGRVDHGDAFLDTHALERSRGITIFAKEARLTLPHTALTLLDTPGHADFGAEMERTLAVLDYAVLIISGTDGVQAHTETLWRLLERYRIPTFIFVNKMDQPGADRALILEELQRKLSPACLPHDAEAEALALCIQNDLNMAVNTREKAAKRIDDSIYIMKHADCPAVLVECGFLSNPEETVLLQQPDYQLHMAAAIAAGFCQYCTNEG